MKFKNIRVALLLIVVAAAVIAQSVTSGSVTGYINDAFTSGALKDVKINLKLNGKKITSATTDVAGSFTFKKIAPAIYSLEATRQGYDTFRIAALQINDGK